MRILAVETSWEKGSICLIDDGEVLREHHLEHPHAHGRDLAPVVMDVLKTNSLAVSDINLICVDIGPGSYTGLRVGVSFVKTLAYAESIPVTTVTSCDAIASEASVDAEKLCVLIDAQWNEYYVAYFREEGDEWVRGSDIHTASPETVAEQVDDQTMILGNGVPLFREREEVDASFGPEKYWYPRASVIGRLGFKSFQDGTEAELYSLQPLYLRPTQADVDRN